jgi:hypothetical protein
MINIVVFSKDRGCQLDLFLCSIKKFFIGIHINSIHVLYTYSNESFGAGYVKAISYHPDIHYVFENKGKFKEDLLKNVPLKNALTMFFVDDMIFKEEFKLSCHEAYRVITDQSVACLSLRLYPGINYCYTMNVPMTVPEFLNKELVWEWRKACPGDWSYPMSLDGHLFRTEDILSKLVYIDYRNPNTLEGNLANSPICMPYMTCFSKSKIVNIPANKVQNVNGNRHGQISAQYLNEQFLIGKRISLTKLLNNPNIINNASCHVDVPIEIE